MGKIDFIVRRAKHDDVAGLSDLFVEFVGEASNINAIKNQIQIINNNPNYFVAVACKNDEIIGTAMGVVCYDLCGECKQFMLIENVVVNPIYRGNGIGKLLMEKLENFALENHCKYIILVSESKRTASHKFYKSLGYSVGEEYGFKKKLC